MGARTTVEDAETGRSQCWCCGAIDRRGVVRRCWQHTRIVGGPLRWIGKRLP